MATGRGAGGWAQGEGKTQAARSYRSDGLGWSWGIAQVETSGGRVNDVERLCTEMRGLTRRRPLRAAVRRQTSVRVWLSDPARADGACLDGEAVAHCGQFRRGLGPLRADGFVLRIPARVERGTPRLLSRRGVGLPSRLELLVPACPLARAADPYLSSPYGRMSVCPHKLLLRPGVPFLLDAVQSTNRLMYTIGGYHQTIQRIIIIIIMNNIHICVVLTWCLGRALATSHLINTTARG